MLFTKNSTQKETNSMFFTNIFSFFTNKSMLFKLTSSYFAYNYMHFTNN